MAILSKTRANVRQEAARILGDLQTGTLTGTPTTTSVADSNLIASNDDHYNGWTIYLTSGTGAPTERYITDYNGTTKACTVGTYTTAPANGDTYEMHKPNGWKASDLNQWVDVAYWEAMRRFLVPKTNDSLVQDSLLSDGNFEVWSGGTLTHWTMSGTATLTQESTIIWEGTSSAKITSTNTSAENISQTISNPYKYASMDATLRVRAYCATADVMRISLYDGTHHYSDYHDGNGWNVLEVEDQTLQDNCTSLIAYIYFTGTAASRAFYVDKAAFYIENEHVYEYTMPSGFVYLSQVYTEGALAQDEDQDEMTSFEDMFNEQIDPLYWRIKRDGTARKLWFNDKLWTPYSGRKLRLVGQGYPTIPTSDSSTIDIPADYVVWKVVELASATRMVGMYKEDANTRRYLSAKKTANDLKDEYTVLPMPNAKIVEDDA